jgi:hypothetical protein
MPGEEDSRSGEVAGAEGEEGEDALGVGPSSGMSSERESLARRDASFSSGAMSFSRERLSRTEAMVEVSSLQALSLRFGWNAPFELPTRTG